MSAGLPTGDAEAADARATDLLVTPPIVWTAAGSSEMPSFEPPSFEPPSFEPESAGRAHAAPSTLNDNFVPVSVSSPVYGFTAGRDQAVAAEAPSSQNLSSDVAPLAVTWVASALVAPSSATDFDAAEVQPGARAGDYGRVMLIRYAVVTGANDAAIAIRAEQSNVVHLTGTREGSGANDNAVWVGDEDGSGVGGVIGRDALATVLHSGDTIVTWVGLDGVLHGKAYPAETLVDADGNDIGPADSADARIAAGLADVLKSITPLAPDQRYRAIDTGRDSFAVLWAATIAGVLVIQGRQFAPAADDGDGWVALDLADTPLAPGAAATTDFAVLGWSAETGEITVAGPIDDAATAPVATKIALPAVSDAAHVSASTASAEATTSTAFGSSSVYSVALGSDDADAQSIATPVAPNAPPPAAVHDAAAFLHQGIVDVAGTGGAVIVGGTFADTDGVAGLSAGDTVTNSDDTLSGSDGDDVLIGDLPDPAATFGDGAVAGGDDTLSGGRGDDVLYGGGGDDTVNGGGYDAKGNGGGYDAKGNGGGYDAKESNGGYDAKENSGGDDANTSSGEADAATASSAAASPPTVDTAAIDTAIFTGNAADYSITANGDGSFTVVVAASDTGTGVDRTADGFEGVDTVANVEQYQFLNGDTQYIVQIVNGDDVATLNTSGHDVLQATDFFTLPVDRNADSDLPQDGTPVAWGLTRDDNGAVENTVVVAAHETTSNHPAAEAPPASPVVAATEDGGFAVGWVEDGAVRVQLFDTLGRPSAEDDSVAIVAPSAGAAIDTAVSPAIDAVADGVAVAVVERGEPAPDPATADAPPAGSTIIVQLVGFGESSGQDCDDDAPAEPAPVAHITVEQGHTVLDISIAGSSQQHAVVTVAWTQSDASDPAGTPSGDIVVQRLAVTEGEDDGEDAATTLSAVGLDGSSGGDDAPTVIGEGHGAAVTAVDDGFAVVWVGQAGSAEQPAAQDQPSAPTAEQLEGRVFSSLGIEIDSFSFLLEGGRTVREGTRPIIDTTDNGDIVIGWQEVHDGASGLSIMAGLLRQLGPHAWSAPLIRELRYFDDAPSEISIAVAGENGDALIVTWRNDANGDGEIVGQRFSVDALADPSVEMAVGVSFNVSTPESSSDHDQSSVVGLDDGRVVVVMREIEPSSDRSGDSSGNSGSGRDDGEPASNGSGGDAPAVTVSIQVEMFDTRDPDDILIGGSQGAAADTHVGTVGDDVIDGRGSLDSLTGGLGDDTLTGGLNDDRLDGGGDNDNLLGGSGTDVLIGGSGDDLLMGGFGRDYISGGDGIDTVSYRGETRSVTVDLAAGIVWTDARHNAVIAPNSQVDGDGISEAVLQDTGVEDLLGQFDFNNCGSGGQIALRAPHGIENIEGGLGDDTLRGDGGDNVISGGKGDDAIDGRDGSDTARYAGQSSDYDIVRRSDGTVEVKHARNVSSTVNDGTDVLTNVEALDFADGQFALGSDGSLARPTIAATLGITSEISVAALDCFQFIDLDTVANGNSGSGSKGSGSSGSSGSGSGTSSGSGDQASAEDAFDGLCGLGSDAFLFTELDAMDMESGNSGKWASGSDLDDLDFSGCMALASDVTLADGLFFGETVDIDVGTLSSIDSFNLKPLDLYQDFII